MSYQVLVVEDDPVHATMIEHILDSATYQTTHITSGLDVLPMMSALQPDVVVLDIMLPDVNGLRVLLELGEFHPQTPVVVVSAYPMLDAAREAQALKHAPKHLEFIAKPYDLDTFTAAIDRAAQRKDA